MRERTSGGFVKKTLALSILIGLLVATIPSESNSEENIICGQITWCGMECQVCECFVGCDGKFYPLAIDTPSCGMNGYIKITNPVFGQVCKTCQKDGKEYCEWCIVGCSRVECISSCAECTSESCEEWLHVKCNVGGYKLYIDGEYVLTEDGDGDSGVELPSGTYTVKLKKEGCDTVSKTVRIECGHETTLRITMDCDPCEDVTCYPKCYGCDYWAMECEDGECVKDYIIERDSEECGCGDPCEGMDCPPGCYGCDYWAMECEDGECVKDYIIEEDSKRCGCGEEKCENAFLWIHCNISGYDLYVDEEYKLTEKGGSADEATSTEADGICGVQLSAGNHKIKLEKTGCETVTETVNLECGEEKTIRLNINCQKEDDRPEFRIVFVPAGWEGDYGGYLTEALRQYNRFKNASGIEEYLRLELIFFDNADLGYPDCEKFLADYRFYWKFREFKKENDLPQGDIYVVVINYGTFCGDGGFRVGDNIFVSQRYSHILAHEIGHYFGLCRFFHCKEDCIMQDKPKEEKEHYCAECLQNLGKELEETAEEKKSRLIFPLVFLFSLLILMRSEREMRAVEK